MARSTSFSVRSSMTFLVFALLVLVAPALAQSSAASSLNDTLLWGPYRPNLYFGIRPRIPKSLVMGLLWTPSDQYQSAQSNFRYTCEQNENMAGYGWTEYDARVGGKQIIHDVQNGLDIGTEFAKVPGGDHGGSWGVRISGVPRMNVPSREYESSAFFFMGLEGVGILERTTKYDPLGFEDSVVYKGQTPTLGDFTIEITPGHRNNKHPPRQHTVYDTRPLDRTMATSLQIPVNSLWQAKGIMFRELKTTIDAYVAEYGEENVPPPSHLFTIGTSETGAGNAHIIQKAFQGPYEFDVLFSSASNPTPMTSESLTAALDDHSSDFEKDFETRVPLQPPYDAKNYAVFSKMLLSNLMGGIGYFHGDHLVDRSYAPEYEEENEGFWEETSDARSQGKQAMEGPYELFSAIPSRPFFPRGFLWDEGFHLIPVLDWDIDVTLEIIQSWLGLMDTDGWIPREIILGEEARSKVPPEFQTQYPHYANPPTLFLTLEALIDKLTAKSAPTANKADKDRYTKTLQTLYPLLKRNYYWYRRTQRGDITGYDRTAFSAKEGYRWRGRTPSHILPSGLDDYPRAQPPHPGELHTDLISWMGMMTRSLKRIAELLGESDDAEEFAAYETAISRNIDDLHWSSKHHAYCDATVDEYEESVHVCHKGYMTLFPFMTGMMGPEHKHLGDILQLIHDPEQLWSEHGVRSLSQSDELYGTEENYWRSPVWINLNYLILDNLLKIATTKGTYQKKARDMYTELRKNLVDTVYQSFVETGFAWEQYNPDTGKGQRTQHFTGWTSLVVKIMTMPDLKSSSGHIEHGEL